ncbi:MAG TPA: hypothetical protein VI032_13525 [Burkholderiaceae bacterium]
MRRFNSFVLMLSAAVLGACSSQTVVVPVPPRLDLQSFGTLGIVEFTSNSDPAINSQSTREFQAHIHSAQPGTRILELGTREEMLAAVGSRQLDAPALRRIGEKYGVDAIFIGNIAYSQPKTDVKVTDATRLEGGVRIEVRGDMTGKLVETRSGASVWSSSAWARRSLGNLSVSVDQGVTGSMRKSNPREEMVPTLVYHLTQDFRPTSVRQQVK